MRTDLEKGSQAFNAVLLTLLSAAIVGVLLTAEPAGGAPLGALVELPPPDPLTASDQRQIECLAQNAYHEARGEGDAGMAAVTAIALNRVGRFAESPCAVVWDGAPAPGCAFSWACDGRPDRVADRRAWVQALAVATASYDAWRDGELSDPTGGADHYHADHVRPRWAASMTHTARIGAHVFYRSPRRI